MLKRLRSNSLRQLWIRTPELGGNISVGMTLLEISSPPQAARKTTFSPSKKSYYLRICFLRLTFSCQEGLQRGKLLDFVVH